MGCSLPVDPNTLLTFCRAVEETTNAGLQLYSREDLLAAKEALKALRTEVELAQVRLDQLTASKPH